jgi:hypothetical protein
MKGRQDDAGRWLIESADASQMALGQRQSVEQTGRDGTTMPARSRSTSTFWPVRRRELPAAKARLAMVSFDFAARSSYLARRSALSSRKRALPPGGQSLRNAALDSARGEMRVEAVFAAIHAIEGHHPTSCHSDKLSEQNVRHSPVARRSNASLWQPFTVSIGGQQQVVYLYLAGNAERPPIRYNTPFPYLCEGALS